MNGAPRIAPGSRREIGLVNAAVASALGAAVGSGPPNIFTTLARHRRLFRPWLRFAGRLMPRGTLPRRDSELVILRVGHNCACEYERRQHESIALSEGLTAEEIARTTADPATSGWTDRERLLLRTADELHESRSVSDQLWAELSLQFSDTELIELCMLVGHYEMLAMTLNALRVQPDRMAARPPSALARLARARR
jgi:alkylhydroperoxidase family enzyme